jgi:hypothetical protein
MTRDDLTQFGRLRIMRATLLGTVFAGAIATASFAETLTVTDLSVPDSPIYKISVPSIEVVDGNIDEAAVRALFTSEAGSFDALAGLDAKSVTIPEITMSSTVEAAGAPPAADGSAGLVSYTYKDVVLTDVVDGVAASATIGSWDIAIGDMVTGSFGSTTTDYFDIGGMLGFYGLTAARSGTEFKQVYGDFTFTGGTISGGDMFSCTVGNAEGGAFTARPLKSSFADIQSLIVEAEAAQTAGGTLEPEKIKQLVLFYADLLTSFRTEAVTFDGFDCSGKDDKGNPMAISAGAMSAGGFEPAKYPEFALNDFRVDVPEEGHVTLGNFTWKKMDFSTAIEVLEAASVMDEAFFVANWRKLIPAMDGFAFSGLDVDVPNPEAAGQRVTTSLGSFDATLGNYVNGIPADIALSLVNLIVPITDDMTDIPIAELKARGITQFDISLGTDLNWDAASSTIKVDDVLIDLGSLGKINLSGTFGNATEGLFADNENQALAAATMLTLKDLTVKVEDRGLGSLLVAMGAQEAGQPEESFRTAMAGMAQGMTLAFLGNTTEALTAAQQLGVFLQGASNLTMTITANDEAGIGLADIAAAETNPAALAGKITVVAEASGEPVTLPLVEGETVQDQKQDLKAPATN